MIFPGLIDLHVHSAPDVRVRRHTDLELAAAAHADGSRAIVLKSHHVPTMDRAWHTARATPGISVFGGVALNWPVGGLNLHAVSTAIKHGAKIIWLPTLHAENHRRKEGRSDGIRVVCDGQVVEAANAIFALIAEANIILATGHLGAEEIPLVVAAAAAKKVKKILINHPEHRVVGMTIAQQRELRRDFPVFFERCYSQPNGDDTYQSNLQVNLRALETLGPESTVLASDAGQIENRSWTECCKQTFEFLSSHGVNDSQLRQMAADTPAQLLGL